VSTSLAWDERYASGGFQFGEAPNDYLRSQSWRLRPGMHAVVPGDGEGRNGVWLAAQGLAVTSLDWSPVGVAKAEALAARHARFRYLPTLSRASEAWTGRRGYVQTHLPALRHELGDAHLYVCGLSKMIDDVRAVLKTDLGVDRRFIHTERYD